MYVSILQNSIEINLTVITLGYDGSSGEHEGK